MVYNPEPPINCFESDVICDVNLFVPNGSVEAYKGAKGWSKFRNIYSIPLTSKVNFIERNIALTIGEKAQLCVFYIPSDAIPRLSCSSDNDKVVTVDDKGNIEALSCGEAVITVKKRDGSRLFDECKVTVQ
ncbi:Ig-like domain-containing protein [Falsiporphyromonas endometrii]|uniref:Ig domain-containing protein n=1 Tax=Falsiporphyromonas endometrii TaxID=1387297 RepID=A0ABV9K819_9PORP